MATPASIAVGKQPLDGGIWDVAKHMTLSDRCLSGLNRGHWSPTTWQGHTYKYTRSMQVRRTHYWKGKWLKQPVISGRGKLFQYPPVFPHICTYRYRLCWVVLCFKNMNYQKVIFFATEYSTQKSTNLPYNRLRSLCWKQSLLRPIRSKFWNMLINIQKVD